MATTFIIWKCLQLYSSASKALACVTQHVSALKQRFLKHSFTDEITDIRLLSKRDGFFNITLWSMWWWRHLASFWLTWRLSWSFPDWHLRLPYDVHVEQMQKGLVEVTMYRSEKYVTCLFPGEAALEWRVPSSWEYSHADGLCEYLSKSRVQQAVVRVLGLKPGREVLAADVNGKDVTTYVHAIQRSMHSGARITAAQLVHYWWQKGVLDAPMVNPTLSVMDGDTLETVTWKGDEVVVLAG